MDALSFIPLQSGVAAAASGATDAPLPDGGVASIDFSTLLALGMNPDSQNAPQADLETEGTAEISAVPQHFAQAAAESPIALPQPVPVSVPVPVPAADVSAATSATVQDAPPADVGPARAADTAVAPAATRIVADAAARMTEGTTAAGVADDPANIAAGNGESPRPTQPGVETQSIEQRADAASDPQQDVTLETRLAAETRLATEAAARTGAQTQAPQIHPAESRAPLAQPSALLEVQAPVSEPGFAQALSRQVVWMVDKDAQVAELRINPPELGPVEVRLTLSQDSAAAEFVSPHAEVRAAIESAIVRLREALAEAGIQLGETSVSAESFSDRPDAQAQSRNARNGYRDAPFADHTAAQSSGRRPALVGHSLVDVFA